MKRPLLQGYLDKIDDALYVMETKLKQETLAPGDLDLQLQRIEHLTHLIREYTRKR